MKQEDIEHEWRCKVLVDANIFLEVELGRSRSKECEEFLTKIMRGEIKAFTTDVILDSIAFVMEREGVKPAKLRKFLESILFYEGLTIYSLNLMDKIITTALMEDTKLDFDDTSTYFTMKSLGIKEIVSFDKDFDKLPGIKRVEPKDVLRK
ncbi:MAG: type II toxin-antitoxin system VapC family toxin [Candidatus Aenigmatarchaeota archaeon]